VSLRGRPINIEYRNALLLPSIEDREIVLGKIGHRPVLVVYQHVQLNETRIDANHRLLRQQERGHRGYCNPPAWSVNNRMAEPAGVRIEASENQRIGRRPNFVRAVGTIWRSTAYGQTTKWFLLHHIAHGKPNAQQIATL
jgi:hypothetical protein